MGVETLSSFNMAMNVELTFKNYIPTMIFCTLASNLISFAIVYLTSYKKVFNSKKAKTNKLLYFLAVQILMMLWYIRIIFNVFLA